ncbi:MAG: PadR family transcriptional regulator [Clostridia bacterium]|nr:PadR family transcriptional regulator [Clostridia bacterium]
MQHIDSDLIRGNIDTIILKTMLNEDKYGLDIIKEVGEKSSGTYELKQPTLYSCLKRLENQELISSYWVDSDIGGRRHYYKLTDKGREFYNKKQEEWAKSKFIIDNLLSNYDYEEYRLVKKDEFDEIIQQKANAPLSNFTQTNFKQSSDAETEDLSLSDENQELETTDTLIDEFKAPKIQPEDVKIEMVEDDDEEYGTYYRGEEDDEDSVEENEELDSADAEDSFENDYQIPNNELPDEYKDMPEFQTIEELEAYLAEKSKANDNDVFNLGEMQNKDFIEEEIEEVLETTEDNDYPVYFSAKPADEEQKQEETVSYETTDQSSNELNFLSRLHSQDDEEINTYYGDQKSYVNHLNQLDESQVEQQDLLDSSLYVKPDLVNKSIDEFYETINKLNSFSSESTSSENEEFEDEVENEVEETNDEPENFDIQETTLRPVETQQADFDDLEELEKLKNISSHAFFYSDDKTSYDEINKTKETVTPVAVENNEEDYEPETYDFDNFTSQTFEEISNTIEPMFQKEEEYDDNLSIDTIASNETETETFETNYEENYDCQNNFTDIDSIISNNMATSYPEATQQFFKSQTNVNYREKLSDLSKYSKVSLEEEKTEVTNTEALEKAKDIAEITKELEEEGIRIKEHYKSTNLKGLDKNYLLANKINLMKSLIMFFGYVFVLSALYIVLNNTKMKEMSWFGITPFLIGFIPFAVVLIYHVVLFAINPYKKVDAKYHARIMLFISIIITIQLLLITYCVNLQLGFYSFAQKQYNHLFWVIPTIISFAPIIDNLVYLALFKSRNFNV